MWRRKRPFIMFTNGDTDVTCKEEFVDHFTFLVQNKTNMSNV